MAQATLENMTVEELRSVVVTGASSGIGAACARYLGEKGFRVFATVRKQKDADEIAALGSSRLEPLLLDVTDAESIARAARTLEAELEGRGLAGLVNNAGISVDVPLECVDIAALRQQLEVNAADQQQMMLRIDKGGEDIDKVVKEWIDANEATWSNWVKAAQG